MFLLCLHQNRKYSLTKTAMQTEAGGLTTVEVIVETGKVIGAVVKDMDRVEGEARGEVRGEVMAGGMQIEESIGIILNSLQDIG